MLWIPCFPGVIITIDLSVLEEGYPKDILVAGSTIQMVIKFLQQVGCIFVVSLAVKVLVPYVCVITTLHTGDGCCKLYTLD